MNVKSKLILKMIAFGSFIIVFCVGWGVNYSLVMYSLMSFYDVGYIDETTYNFGLYGMPIIGLAVIISTVLYLAFGTIREPSRNKVVNNS